MKKFLSKAILFLFGILFPFATLITVIECLPAVYDKTFVAALPDKIERLKSTQGKKIVFIGGSSLPFGLDCGAIEQALDKQYQAVDFGLYATLGTKIMIDLSERHIKSGDIVVITPELHAQTYSLYFNPQAVLEALEGFSWETRVLSSEENGRLFYRYYKFAYDKMKRLAAHNIPEPDGIYRRDSFDGYGDIKVERAYNIMANGVDENMLVYTDDQLLDTAFIEYINAYVKRIRKKGAQVYFNFGPTNILAFKSSKAQRAKFQTELKEKLDCEVLCDIENCVLDQGYFYDTNFHCNTVGAKAYTEIVINDIKRVLNLDAGNPNIPSAPDIPSPDVPDVPDRNVDFSEYDGGENIDYADWFEYRLMGNGYQVVGVKNEYKDMAEVIVPTQWQGRAVNTIGTNAFYGCTSLKRIHIGKSIRSLVGTPFNGCISLEGVYMYEANSDNVIPPSQGLLDGANRNAKIYVPQGANYETGYTWEGYRDRLEVFSR